MLRSSLRCFVGLVLLTLPFPASSARASEDAADERVGPLLLPESPGADVRFELMAAYALDTSNLFGPLLIGYDAAAGVPTGPPVAKQLAPSDHAADALEAEAGGPSKLQGAVGVVIDPALKFVYFGSDFGRIYGYTLSSRTRAIAADVPGSPVSVPGGVEGIALDPSGRFLAVVTSDPSTVRLYTVNRSTGALTLAGSFPVLGQGRRVAFDGSGRFVYAARRGDGPGQPGGLSVFAVNRTTGAFAAGPAVPALEGHEIFTLIGDHQGRFLFVSDGTALALQRFAIDGSTGALAALGTGGLPFCYGLGIDPDDAFVYGGIFGMHVARLDGATGGLSEVAGSPFATSVANPLNVATDSAGRFVYALDIAANLPSNGVPLYGFRLDRASGALTPLAGSPFDAGESAKWIDFGVRSGLDDARLGEPYSANVSAYGGAPPYTFSVVAGALPSGLALHAATGFVSGTPLATGVASLTVRATDRNGQKVDRAYAMTVFPAGTTLPPPGAWLTSPALPGYGVKATIGGVPARLSAPCSSATLCLAATSASAADAFVRISALQPNGYLWPSIARFSTAKVQLWLRRDATLVVRSYTLPAAPPAGKALNGVVDRNGFLPRPALEPTAAREVEAIAAPAPPAGSWLTATSLPGFQFKVRFGGSVAGTKLAACSDLALCVAGSVKTSPAAFLRIQRPNANGFLWPLAVKLTTVRVEVWVQQIKGGKTVYYDLPATAATASVLAGAIDRTSFKP